MATITKLTLCHLQTDHRNIFILFIYFKGYIKLEKLSMSRSIKINVLTLKTEICRDNQTQRFMVMLDMCVFYNGGYK